MTLVRTGSVEKTKSKKHDSKSTNGPKPAHEPKRGNEQKSENEQKPPKPPIESTKPPKPVEKIKSKTRSKEPEYVDVPKRKKSITEIIGFPDGGDKKTISSAAQKSFHGFMKWIGKEEKKELTETRKILHMT